MLRSKASASVLGHNYKSAESTWSGLNALPTKIYLTREQNYFDVSPVHRKVSLLLSQKKSLPDRSGRMMYSLSFLDCDALFDDGDLRAVSKKNQRVGKLERERFKMRDCRKFNIGTGTISRITTFSCVATTEKTYSDDKVSMCPPLSVILNGHREHFIKFQSINGVGLVYCKSITIIRWTVRNTMRRVA